MRDIIFKNLTFLDKGRKVMSSSEIAHQKGVCQVVHRHFIYKIKEINEDKLTPLPKPSLRIVKNHNSYEKKETFFYKFKSSLYILHNQRLYKLEFLHSLRIKLFIEAPNFNLR